MAGWIRLHRSLAEWEWYTDSKTLHLFLHLLIKANHKPVRHRGTVIERGQLLTGRKQLASETGISEQSVRTALTRLKSTNEITIQSTKKFSIITICNYDKYQDTESEVNQVNNQTANQQLTNNQPATNHKQECKEDLNTLGGGVRARVDPPVAPPLENRPPESPPQPGPKHTDCPSKSRPSYQGFKSCWQVYPLKQDEEAAWKEWCRLEDKRLLPDSWMVREAIILLTQEDDKFQRGYLVPFAKWLNGKRWNDEPYQKPAQQNGGPPGISQGGQGKVVRMTRDQAVHQENYESNQRLMLED